MSNVAAAFTAPDGSRKKAFIPFVTCGDPDLATTAALVRAMADAGADLIELGIPFSDPTAEGPVIMAASERALAGGVTTDSILAMVRDLRADGLTVPLAFMTYANVVFSYGIDRFCAAAAEAGIDALVLPDVPFEERSEFEEPAAAVGIDLVPLIAPTSAGRIGEIAQAAKGYIYVVSSLGVTGVRAKITTDVAGIVQTIREATDVPCAIGFGISTPEQAAKMAAASDGAIVGSAIVRMVGEYGADAVEPVAAYVREMAEAVHGA